uniref:Uncharacterized protein n=1 Tax=Clastoptera arizonana TaxID=38151 RepID=A0A1B6DWD3_9HEMI
MCIRFSLFLYIVCVLIISRYGVNSKSSKLEKTTTPKIITNIKKNINTDFVFPVSEEEVTEMVSHNLDNRVENKFLFQVPLALCPPGQKRDARGKCRKEF